MFAMNCYGTWTLANKLITDPKARETWEDH